MKSLNNIAKDPYEILTRGQKRKLDEAMALVDRTELPLCCNVCLQCHCCSITFHMFICLCHCNARLSEDVELVKGLMQTKVDFMEECLDLLETEPKPDEDEPVPRADEDMRKGKASGKGKPLRVPELDDEDGPKWIEEGWVSGWKLWVGDLPGGVRKTDVGQYCEGQVDVSVQSNKTRSGMAFAIVTFLDLTMAIKAFEQVAMAKFDHGNGQMYWPTVKWFRGRR